MSQTTIELRALLAEFRDMQSEQADTTRSAGLSPEEFEWHDGAAHQAKQCADRLEAVLATLTRHEQAQGGMAVAVLEGCGDPRHPCRSLRWLVNSSTLPPGTQLYTRPTADARQETQG